MTRIRLPNARPLAVIIAAIGVASLAPGTALAASSSSPTGITNTAQSGATHVSSTGQASSTESSTETVTPVTVPTDGAAAPTTNSYPGENGGEASAPSSEAEVDGGNSGDVKAEQDVKIEAKSGDSGDSGDGGKAESSNTATSGDSGDTGGNTSVADCTAEGESATCSVDVTVQSGDSGNTGAATNDSTTEGGHSGNTGATGAAGISSGAIGNISNSAMSGDTNVDATADSSSEVTMEDNDIAPFFPIPVGLSSLDSDSAIVERKPSEGGPDEGGVAGEAEIDGGNSGDVKAEQDVNMEAQSGDSGDSGDGGKAESMNTAVSGNSGSTGGNSSVVTCEANGDGSSCVITVNVTSGNSGDTGNASNTSSTIGGNSGNTGATGSAQIGDIINPETPTSGGSTEPTNGGTTTPTGTTVAGESAAPTSKVAATTAGVAVASTGQLPFTGLPLGWTILLACMLLAAGVAMQMVGRLRAQR